MGLTWSMDPQTCWEMNEINTPPGRQQANPQQAGWMGEDGRFRLQQEQIRTGQVKASAFRVFHVPKKSNPRRSAEPRERERERGEADGPVAGEGSKRIGFEFCKGGIFFRELLLDCSRKYLPKRGPFALFGKISDPHAPGTADQAQSRFFPAWFVIMGKKIYYLSLPYNCCCICH